MSTGGVSVELPWPPRELSPNARIHYLAKSRVTKAYREQAYWLSMAARGLGESPGDDGPILLAFTFHPPDRRRRDLDTMLSSVKAGIDGIADALGVNDVRFEYALKRAEPVKNGRVVIVIGEGA